MSANEKPDCCINFRVPAMTTCIINTRVEKNVNHLEVGCLTLKCLVKCKKVTIVDFVC